MPPAARGRRRFPPHCSCRVDTRDQPLGCGFLVPRCPIDLTCEKQTANPPRFQCRSQFRGLNEIVLDGISGPDHPRVLESWKCVHQLLLDGHRQRHREAIYVDFVSFNRFRFEIDLMSFPIWEPHDLVFQRRTVARTDAADLSVIQRTLANVLPARTPARDRSCDSSQHLTLFSAAVVSDTRMESAADLRAPR